MAETATAAAPAEKEKKAKKPKLPALFDSLELAKKAADEREKGPRRVFVAKHGGKTLHILANNEGRAGGVAFATIGGTVEEIGGRVRKAKGPQGIAGIMEAIAQLPEAERAGVLAQLKQLMPAGGKK